MFILGIETSCDETAAAVVENGQNVLSSVVSSQFEIHGRFGGIVPELASRDHIRKIIPVIEESLTQAKLQWSQIHALGVTSGPGLIGSLMVGVTVAKAIAYTFNKPLIGVHHIEGHLSSAWLADSTIEFPFLGLVASGGHTHVYLASKMGEYKLLAKTTDDAAGEAFDKVAKLLGLGFPGGPAIDKWAKLGNPNKIRFPRPNLHSQDFSFSGLKTAVNVWLKNNQGQDYKIEDVAASFQEAVVDTIVGKLAKLAKAHQVRQVVLCGGVGANSRLRDKIFSIPDVKITMTPLAYCTDNAAMIAAAAYLSHAEALPTQFESFNLEPLAHVGLT